MKKNDYKNLKTKKIEDLKKMVSEKKLELSKFLSKKTASGEKNLKKGKSLRKDIAQILTVVKETEILDRERTIK